MCTNSFLGCCGLTANLSLLHLLTKDFFRRLVVDWLQIWVCYIPNSRRSPAAELWIDCKSEFVTLVFSRERHDTLLWIDCKSEFVTFPDLDTRAWFSCGLTANLSLLHSSVIKNINKRGCGLTANLSLLHSPIEVQGITNVVDWLQIWVCYIKWGTKWMNWRLWIDCKSEFVTFAARDWAAAELLWIDCKSEFVTFRLEVQGITTTLWIDCKSEFVTFSLA